MRLVVKAREHKGPRVGAVPAAMGDCGIGEDDRMKALTPKQRETLEYFMFFVEYHGYVPRLRDLAFKFQITVKAVSDRLRWLEKKGYVKFDPVAHCHRVLRNPAGNDVRLVFEEVK
jgi:hypothetical protein